MRSVGMSDADRARRRHRGMDGRGSDARSGRCGPTGQRQRRGRARSASRVNSCRHRARRRRCVRSVGSTDVGLRRSGRCLDVQRPVARRSVSTGCSIGARRASWSRGRGSWSVGGLGDGGRGLVRDPRRTRIGRRPGLHRCDSERDPGRGGQVGRAGLPGDAARARPQGAARCLRSRRRSGWPRAVAAAGCSIVGESTTTRRRVAASPRRYATALPSAGWAVRRWLREPARDAGRD